MGDQLFLERFIWFDSKVRGNRYPNAFKLAEEFEVSQKTAQRSIEYFRDRLLAPLQYDYAKRGYFYEDPDFQLPLTRISEEELLALLISRKLISKTFPPSSVSCWRPVSRDEPTRKKRFPFVGERSVRPIRRFSKR